MILAGIKGDLQLGKFTLREWPEMTALVQQAMERGMVKGATWEQIEEQRKDVANVSELVATAVDTTHVVIASCPAVHFDAVAAAIKGNRNIHESYARSGDVNNLFG